MTESVLVPCDRIIPWLDRCQGGWKFLPLKYLCEINGRVLLEDTNPDYEFLYVDIGNVNSEGQILSVQPYKFEDAPSRARRKVVEGDVLISTVRTYLKAITQIKNYDSSNPVICSTGFVVLSAGKNINPNYLAYWVRSQYFIDEVVARSCGVSYPATNASEIGSLPFPDISLPEQETIARFLDDRISKIDDLIAKKQRQNELVKEKLQVVINKAVIKGLSSISQLKQTTNTWFEEIPSHWGVKRLKYSIKRLANGIWGSEPDGMNDITCIRVADFDRDAFIVSLDNQTKRAVTISERENRQLINGDLLLEKSGGGQLQPVGVVVSYLHNEPAVCSNFIARLEVNSVFDARYLAYYYSYLYSQKVNYRSIKQTTGIQNIDTEDYLNELTPVPPIQEQKEIAKYLDNKIAEVGQMKAKIERSVNLLQEYRSALITAAVTGKIDVRKQG